MTTHEQQRPSVCECGKICKNEKGLRIHQGKMKCKERPQQRTAQPAGEAEENRSQEANHSAPDLRAEVQEETVIERRKRVKWPKGNDSKAWNQLEEDLINILHGALKGEIENKIRTFTNIVYNVSKERFGVMEGRKEGQRPIFANRRNKKKAEIRRDLKTLSAQWRNTESQEEKEALDILRDVLRKKLKNIANAERMRKKRMANRKEKEEFISNPFQYTSKLLGKPRSGKLNATKEEVEKYLQDIHSDPKREEPLRDIPRIEQPNEPIQAFDLTELSLSEVQQVVAKARSKSAPGPSGIPYLLYKKCPKLTKMLHKLMKTAWKKEIVPECWTRAEGCFVPKELNSEGIKQFRTISLLDVEGKIQFSVLARRFTKYMVANQYIDTSVQKGGVEGLAGCWEHNSMITQLLKEARQHKGDLTLIWLDLANAYGSVPHALVKEALKRYHIPAKVQNMIARYLDMVKFRFTVNDVTTQWQNLEIGIITGCTISVIVFLTAMQLIIKTAAREAKGPKLQNGERQQPLKAFMDDLTICAQKPQAARWVLVRLEELVKWARMAFKARKCRSLVIKKGTIEKRNFFQIQGEKIPTVSEEPVKCLGKWYDGSLRDTENARKTVQQLQEQLNLIESKSIPGRYKAWCFQFGIMPRLTWPLLMYDIPMSKIEALERIASRYLRKWLGVPPSFSAVGLYSKTSSLKLPLSSIIEEYKVGKIRGQMQLRESKDETVAKADARISGSRKWSVQKSIEDAESRVRMKDLIGTVRQGRKGLEVTDRARWSETSGKEKTDLVLQEVRAHEEEGRKVKAVAMATQGAWTRWEAVTPRNLKWGEILKMEPLRLSFLLRSIYDVLPTPVNLKRWKLAEDDRCILCNKRASLEHILSSCNVSLTQGRYRWRHDTVLGEIAKILEGAVARQKKTKPRGLQLIRFIKEGQKPNKSVKDQTGVLATANDWQIQVDLKKRLIFPQEIYATSLRPDIVIWSCETKQIVIAELTVPWEDRAEVANERKRTKYDELRGECEERGYKVYSLPIEIGCRGFVCRSVWTMCKVVGLQRTEKNTMKAMCEKAAERTSCWLWLRRNDKTWNVSP